MGRITRTATMLAAGIALAWPTTVRAQQTTVAVVPFNVREAKADSRDFQGIGTAIADLLAADLRASAGVKVTDRAPTGRTAALQPRVRDGMLGRQGAVDAAKLLGAQHVVFGGFAADASGNVRIDARAVNVGTGAVELTERLQGRGDDIVALVHQLAARLAGGMSLPAATGAAGGSSLPLRALVEYGRALEAGDRGDRAQARQLLEGVVRDHPDFAAAKSALAGAPDR